MTDKAKYILWCCLLKNEDKSIPWDKPKEQTLRVQLSQQQSKSAEMCKIDNSLNKNKPDNGGKISTTDDVTEPHNLNCYHP